MSEPELPAGWPAMSIAQAHAMITQPGSPAEVETIDIRGVPIKVWKNAPPSLRAVVEAARAHGGKDFLVVTPGVRPDWSAKNDQARAATPADALRAGASHIVCGRPITAANDPHAAALRVAGEMAGV